MYIAGITTNHNAEFMAQVARNLTERVDGFLRDAKWLILDRDSKITEQFRRNLDEAGVGVLTTAFQAPNMNAIAERFIGSINRECLSKLILFGEDICGARSVSSSCTTTKSDHTKGSATDASRTGLTSRRLLMVRWSPTSDLAGCCAATAVRPDGQGHRRGDLGPTSWATGLLGRRADRVGLWSSG